MTRAQYKRPNMYRVFGGKRYKCIDGEPLKKDAVAAAKIMRKAGYRVRVVPMYGRVHARAKLKLEYYGLFARGGKIRT